MAIINDRELFNEIVSNIMEQYELSETKAMEIAKELIEDIINAMWNEYSHVLDQDIQKYLKD